MLAAVLSLGQQAAAQVVAGSPGPWPAAVWPGQGPGPRYPAGLRLPAGGCAAAGLARCPLVQRGAARRVRQGRCGAAGER
jgi:hypothetical protein